MAWTSRFLNCMRVSSAARCRRLLCLRWEKYEALFEELKQEQVDHVIAVPLTSGISSTAEMIQAAAHRAEMPLTLIDPYTTVNIQGYLALCAHQLAQQGVEPAEIERRLKACVEHSNSLLVPDDLHHLKRGGRLTPLAATLGSMLKIKPLLQLNPGTAGRVDVLEKVRTMSRALSRMADVAQDEGFDPKTYELTVLDSEAEEGAQQMMHLLEERFPGVQIHRSSICPVIASHTGMGVVAVQYIRKPEGIE